MHASAGDHLHVHGRIVGQREQVGVILEVRGPQGDPPYLARYRTGTRRSCTPARTRSWSTCQQLSRCRAHCRPWTAGARRPDRWPRGRARPHPGRASSSSRRSAPATGCCTCGCRTPRPAWPCSRPAPAATTTCWPPCASCCPPDDRWRHRHGSPGHGRDHVLPALCPPYATVPVVEGRMALGTWQSVCLVDLNGDNPLRQVRLSFLSRLTAGPWERLASAARGRVDYPPGARPRGGRATARTTRGRHRVTATADNAGGDRLAGRLGLSPGQVVQELGYDDDCDEALRAAVAALTGNALVDEDHEDVVDVGAAVVARRRRRPGRRAGRLADLPRRRRRGLAADPEGRPARARRAGRHRRRGAHRGPAPDQQHLRRRRLVGHPAGHPPAPVADRSARHAGQPPDQPAEPAHVVHRRAAARCRRAGRAPPRRSAPAPAGRSRGAAAGRGGPASAAPPAVRPRRRAGRPRGPGPPARPAVRRAARGSSRHPARRRRPSRPPGETQPAPAEMSHRAASPPVVSTRAASPADSRVGDGVRAPAGARSRVCTASS